MSVREQHRLGRSIRSLAVSVQVARERRAQMNDLVRGDERIEELQQLIEGTATATQATTTYTLTFDHIFAAEGANGRRQANLYRPQLVGAELELTRVTKDGATTSLMPWFQFAVTDWIIDEHETVLGCRLAVTVALLGVSDDSQVDFRGFAHLTFHGYGSPTEKPDEED